MRERCLHPCEVTATPTMEASMTAEPDRPPVAGESGRPAASDDPVTERAAVAPDEMAEESARPDEELFEALRERGWTGTPFVIRGGEVLGNTEMYDVAEQLGIADRIPRIGLQEVFQEAGLRPGPPGGGPRPEPGRRADPLGGFPRRAAASHTRQVFDLTRCGWCARATSARPRRAASGPGVVRVASCTLRLRWYADCTRPSSGPTRRRRG
jgi:hypothetical protein